MAKRALCVGINDYPVDGADLMGCVNDANDWATLLTEHYDFTTADVRVMTDAEATKANVMAALGNSFMGAENCRANTRDPSLWSMHSFWGPVLAMDIGVASLPLGDEINRFIENKPELNELIVIWREPLHFNHLHAQVGHNRSGAPSCA